MSGAPGWGFYCLIIVNASQQSLLVDQRLSGFGPLLQRLHVGLNDFKRIDATRSPVSSEKVLFIGFEGPLTLSHALLNTGDTVKTICGERASTLNSFPAWSISKSVLTPTDEPPVDLQGLFVSLQHGERSRRGLQFLPTRNDRALPRDYFRLNSDLEIPLKNVPPKAPTASNAPNIMAASMLWRPCGNQ